MTENQIPYEQEEEINLISLLFTVLHKYRQMAAAALVCAVLFAGVAVVKNISWNAAIQKAAEEGETVPRTSAQQTYEEDMVEYRAAQNKHDTDVQSYNQQLRDNERSQQTVQFNIDNAEEYMEKSVLNSIDPYNVYNARADLYVTTDYKIMPGMDYQNPDYTSSVLSAYTSLLTNHEAISAIAEQFNMEERYMRELVSVWGDDSTRLLSISINAASEEDATAILDAVIARMNGLYETIESTVGHHSITLLSRTSSVTVSTDLRDQQQNTRDNLTSLQNQMTDLQAQHDLLEQNIQKADQDLAALKVPEEPGDDSPSLVKFAVIGFVLGVILIAGAAVVKFLTADLVYSAKDLKSTCNLPVLGTLAGAAARKAVKLDAKLNKLEGRPDGSRDDETVRLIAATIASRAPKADRILVTGDLPAEQLSALTAQLQAADTLRSRKLTCAESVLVSSTAVLEVNAADAVVLVADCSCSRYSSVNDQKEQIARLGKTVLGCVVYE